MATKLEVAVTVNGKEETYTLEYNRAAVKNMEARGFSIREYDDKLATQMDLLLQGALEMHHKGLNNTVREAVMSAIYDEYDVMDLYTNLMNMAVEAIPVLRDSSSGAEGKKKLVIVK